MIKRTFENVPVEKTDDQKAIVLSGSRQVDKITLVGEVAAQLSTNFLYVNANVPTVRLRWSNQHMTFL